MSFSAPGMLWLLALLPLAAWMGWPGGGGARERLSLALRLALLACLVLSLAGPGIVRGGDELAVVFLVDVSDSMTPAAVAAAMDYVDNALAAIGPDDRAAVVLFAAQSLVVRPMSPGSALEPPASTPPPDGSDLAGALRLAMALFPPESARRIVVLSDGAGNGGDALAAARQAAASGVQVLVVPLLAERGSEALVAAVSAPGSARSGERFDLDVSLRASEPVGATLQVLAGGELVYQGRHALRRGESTLRVPLQAGEPGFVTYQVQLVPDRDGFYQNNLLQAVMRVEGPPRVLLSAPAPGERLPGGETRPDESSHVLRVFEAAGYQVDLVAPNRLPVDLASLAVYDAVALVDVPARALGDNQMRALQGYVRDLGGGLVTVGGPTSYGVGGYYGTPLEETLPVEMQIRDEQRRPTLAIVFVIDRSGSMGETSGGVEKLELAKEAAARSVELLYARDRVGVVAFDDSAGWVVPLTDLADVPEVTGAIGSLEVGGGTDILAGLQAMAQTLPGDPALAKHVILLTDGGADPSGIPELVESLHREHGITLSTVGVGSDAAPYLEQLAALGGGRYHFAQSAESIPSIFTEETALATRAYLVEQPFVPRLASPSGVLAGIEAVPRLRGYVATSPKPLAQVMLVSHEDDPVLAVWQYGLGRALAFTSDASGRWARDWLRWEGFGTFWTQALGEVSGRTSAAGLELDVSLQGGAARLTLEAYDSAGAFLNGYLVQASIASPEGESQVLTLRQVAPGRYQGDFIPGGQGGYLLRLTGRSPEDGEGEGFAETAAWTLAYSPEYLALDPDPDLLARVAALTGGGAAHPDPAAAFRHDLPAQRAARPAWPWLLALAAVLLPVDVAARRLVLTREDLVRLRAWALGRLGARSAGAQAPVRRAERMQSLLRAKERAGTAASGTPGPVPAPAAPRSAAREAPPTPDARPPEPESPPEETAPPASTTAALLARKKSVREKREGE